MGHLKTGHLETKRQLLTISVAHKQRQDAILGDRLSDRVVERLAWTRDLENCTRWYELAGEFAQAFHAEFASKVMHSSVHDAHDRRHRTNAEHT